jgi:isopentenyl phosphate kinase
LSEFSLLNLQFLKLGGSLITDKTQPHTPRLEVINRLAAEIAAARQREPALHLVLGHGSGSYGHVPALRYATRQGVHTPEEWQGFVEVWREAIALNRLVMDALEGAGLPAVSLPPLSSVVAAGGRVSRWDLTPLQAALAAGLIPVVFGDVVIDLERGGVILSTEDLFAHLAHALRPRRLLLAGLEPGVWADYPVCSRLLAEITPQNLDDIEAALLGSASPDVTGGMDSKVRQNLALTQDIPGLEVFIFSAETPGMLEMVLSGEPLGTRIAS